MGFNRNELQPDDDFNFDDDFDFDEPAPDARSSTGSGRTTSSSSRSLGDDDFNFDDDFSSDNTLDDDSGGMNFNTDEDDMPEFDGGSEEGGGGGRRPFVILAAVLIGLFLCALLGIGILASGLIPGLRIGGPSDLDLTATAIVATNQFVETEVAIRSTDQAIAGATQTAIALLPTATFTPLPTETPTIPPSITPLPTVDETQAAAFAVQTQAVLDATETAIALAIPPTQPPLDANAISITATFLAGIIQQPTVVAGTQVALAPTQEVIGGTPPGPRPTALPNTGFFEDVTGTGGMGLILLMAGALVAVIIVSRRLRTA
jgi:hypothetical protein